MTEKKNLPQKATKKEKPAVMVKTVKDLDKDLLVFRCTKKLGKLKGECGNVHFRHAGYMEFLVPYIKSSKEGKVQTDSFQVKVCTKCKTCYVYIDSKFYDVTIEIDLEAWEETEKELQKATGPGGDC